MYQLHCIHSLNQKNYKNVYCHEIWSNMIQIFEFQLDYNILVILYLEKYLATVCFRTR